MYVGEFGVHEFFLNQNQLTFEFSFMSKVLKNETEPLGVVVLKNRGFFPDAYWYWIGVGALLGFVLLYNFCFTLSLAYLNRGYLCILSCLGMWLKASAHVLDIANLCSYWEASSCYSRGKSKQGK